MKAEAERWSAELRELRHWRNFAAVSDAGRQDQFCAWLWTVRTKIVDGFDPRVSGDPRTAKALREEAIRLLALCRSLGLREQYVKRIEAVSNEILADDSAVRVPRGLATLGFESAVGRRGGASDREGALCGWIVRMISTWCRDDVEHRFAAIAAFARHAGVPCSPANARAILMGGRT